MQSEAVKTPLPIFKEKCTVTWRDEKAVYIRARKCRCNSVWCVCCSKLVWSKKTAMDMRTFDWPRTREIVLTIRREGFEDGKEAYAYAMEHKLIPGFMRNLQRGKKIKRGKDWVQEYEPVKVTKWLAFLEWHKDGFPHWHIIVETEQYGRFSQIGEAMIHHYWPQAVWVYENYFNSAEHWNKKVGYFGSHGYFQDDKEHQTRLPEWALNIPGLKIRRSTHSKRLTPTTNDAVDSIEEGKKAYILDPDTGELLSPKSITYDRRFKLCGRCTFLTIFMKGKQIDGLFNLPYREVRKTYQGQYREGTGYMFHVSQKQVDALLPKMISGKEKRYPQALRLREYKVIRHWCHTCGDRTYQRLSETKDCSDVYLCLRCKNVNEFKDRP